MSWSPTPSRLLLALALGGAALGSVAGVLLVPATAHAQSAPVFEGQGVIELIPPSGLVGDGATSADLYVVAVAADGKPIAGLKGKPTPSGGTAGDLVEVGGGVYKFSFLPPRLEARGAVTFTLKTRLPSKEPLNRTWTVPVEPSPRHQVTVAANPGQLTLNQDKNASVSISLRGGDAAAMNAAELRASVSSGSVDNLTNLGNGQYSALFTTPSVGYPHVALITVADRKDPTHTYGATAIPLVGKADFPVTVAPNAKVMLKVAGREFGPIQADAQGRARVPIIVPPGATGATKVQITADNKVSEEPIDLKIPEGRRVALIPTSTAIPSDARMQVPLRVFVVTPDGKPDENAQVVMNATAGVVGPARHEGGGIYVVPYTPPTGNVSTQATVSVSLANGSTVQTDSMTLALVPTRPTKVTLSPEPTMLAAGADGFKVHTRVMGPDGTGLGQRTITFTANGAKLKEIKDLRNGDYLATFSTIGNGPAEVSAVVSSSATGNPLYRVLLIPNRDRVPNDGLSVVAFTVVTVDEYGYPVPNVPVNLRLVSGDGSVPSTTTTGPDGVAQVYYTAGRKNTLVTAEATSGSRVAAASVFQVASGVTLPSIPLSGQAAPVTLRNEWAGSLASARIEREGMTGAVVTPSAPVAVGAARPGSGEPAVTGPTAPTTATPVSGSATAASRLGLVAEPASVAPGGSTTLKITLTDDAGRGVAGQSLDFLTSAGTVGAVTDLGGGAYTAVLSVPAGTAGEVKISVATRDGTVSTFARLPVGQQAMWSGSSSATPFATSATSTPTTATLPTGGQPTTVAPMGTTDTTPPASTTTATVTRTDAGERPWLRFRVGAQVGSYQYDSTPLSQEGALFPTPLGIGSVAPGFQANLRMWSPGFAYAGVDVGVGTSTYSIDPAPLCAELGRPCDGAAAQTDWVNRAHAWLLGRYPFEVGANRYWLGARVGYAVADLQAIQVSGDELLLPQLPVNGLALGVEVGADVGTKLFLGAGFTETLAGGSTPWDTAFDAEVGYAFLDNVYASLAYNLSLRNISVLDAGNEKIGEIADASNAGVLSVGVQF